MQSLCPLCLCGEVAATKHPTQRHRGHGGYTGEDNQVAQNLLQRPLHQVAGKPNLVLSAHHLFSGQSKSISVSPNLFLVTANQFPGTPNLILSAQNLLLSAQNLFLSAQNLLLSAQNLLLSTQKRSVSPQIQRKTPVFVK